MTNYKNKTDDKNNNTSKKDDQHAHTSNRGFASMPTEKVQEIAHKGGEARAAQLGHEGYVELGHKGGEARAEQLGHEGYVELGHKGGSAPHESRPGRSGSHNDENDNNRSQASASRSETDRGPSASKAASSGKQGFASMPKEKVQEAARKGGESSPTHRRSA